MATFVTAVAEASRGGRNGRPGSSGQPTHEPEDTPSRLEMLVGTKV
jgi:hypothetical protein